MGDESFHVDGHTLTDRQTEVMKLIADFCYFVDAVKHLYYGCTQNVFLTYIYFLTADGSVVTEEMEKKIIILLCSINWFMVDHVKCHLQ